MSSSSPESIIIMDSFTHFIAVESLVQSVDSLETFRGIIRVMLGDKRLTWGRVVVISEVALSLVHRYPEMREDIMKVMSDACNVRAGIWDKL